MLIFVLVNVNNEKEYEMSVNESITKLAEQCLNTEGLESFNLLLAEEKIDAAKAYVLGAIDSLWTKKQISDSEAAEAYQILNVNPEKASSLRQDSKHWT